MFMLLANLRDATLRLLFGLWFGSCGAGEKRLMLLAVSSDAILGRRYGLGLGSGGMGQKRLFY